MSTLKDNVVSSDLLMEYLRNKGENHQNYKLYTSNKVVVDSILESSSLFLTNGCKWNDIQDRVNFNPSDSMVTRFGLCMAYGKSENVAMWMLYGKNDGYMMDFPKRLLQECLEKRCIECGKIRNDRFEKCIEVNESDFKIELIDIIYYGETKDNDTKNFYIKRADESGHCPVDIINGLQYCKKNLPWQYECECRLVVTIDKTIINNPSFDTVKIEFSSTAKEALKKRIFHSPNFNGLEVYERSKLKGMIQWSI